MRVPELKTCQIITLALSALMLSIVLASCSSDEGTSSTTTTGAVESAMTDSSDTAPSTQTSQPADDDEPKDLEEDFPCDLLTDDEIAQIAGNPLDGDVMTGDVDENGVQYSARSCVWTGKTPDVAMEVTLNVSTSADFPKGQSTCPPPLDRATPVTGVGESANWLWIDAGTEEKVGELRVCSADNFLKIQTSGTFNEAQQQDVARSIAEKALSDL